MHIYIALTIYSTAQRFSSNWMKSTDHKEFTCVSLVTQSVGVIQKDARAQTTRGWREWDSRQSASSCHSPPQIQGTGQGYLKSWEHMGFPLDFVNIIAINSSAVVCLVWRITSMIRTLHYKEKLLLTWTFCYKHFKPRYCFTWKFFIYK